MKLLSLVALQVLCLSVSVHAATYLSSMGSAPQSFSEIWNDGIAYDSWGLPFSTGSSDTILNGITVSLKKNAGTSPITASLFLADGNMMPIGTPISTGFTYGAISTSDFGAVTFTPGSEIILDSASTYVFVFSTSEGGSYHWQNTVDSSYSASGGWSFPQPFVMNYQTSQYGSPVWGNGGGGDYHFMGAIDATQVPEPSLLCLGALGLVAFGFRRSRM